MVRRGAAQSLSILADAVGASSSDIESEQYLMPLLKSLLADDSDGVKIHAVYSMYTVAKVIHNKQKIELELLPTIKAMSTDKASTWRLKFAIAETTAKLGEFLDKDAVDNEIVSIYEALLTDKEAEVRSESVGKLPELA